MEQKRGKTVIVKPVSMNCNGNCDYCYNLALEQLRSDRAFGSMNLKTAWNLQQGLVGLGLARYRLIFHGGEPLLRGLPFYGGVVEQQQRIRKAHPELKIQNGVQSNFTRLTPEWCTFFKKYHFSIGTSIDGWRELHNAHRKYKNGSGTYDDVMRGLLMARGTGILGGFISVITDATMAEDPVKYLDWLLSLNANAEVSPCWEMPGEDGTLSSYVVTSEELLPYLQTMFDAWWVRNDPQKRLRLFHGFMQGLLGGREMTCEFKGNCGDFLAIECDGSVYPCGKFSGLPGFKLGNVNEQPLTEILAQEKYQDWLRLRTELPGKCQVCKWAKICNNGCTYERYQSNGTYAEIAPFCEVWSGMYEHVDGKIKTLQAALAERNASA